ncbi:Uncharacterized protein ACMD2_12452 [Ananas comosus]|uniref:Uncharacterized protein n=1 Tax=Ananas comosus TaxID=4615 RepID=A0A199UFX6_ANACO|nr:Uncharacterized protein ACMD2_12452 [Ananas comosus]
MCYVGKATKIFFFVVILLVVVGLVVGFGLLRRGAKRRVQDCGADPAGCRPISPEPATATAAAAPPPPPPPPLAAQGPALSKISLG